MIRIIIEDADNINCVCKFANEITVDTSPQYLLPVIKVECIGSTDTDTDSIGIGSIGLFSEYRYRQCQIDREITDTDTQILLLISLYFSWSEFSLIYHLLVMNYYNEVMNDIYI